MFENIEHFVALIFQLHLQKFVSFLLHSSDDCSNSIDRCLARIVALHLQKFVRFLKLLHVKLALQRRFQGPWDVKLALERRF